MKKIVLASIATMLLVSPVMAEDKNIRDTHDVVISFGVDVKGKQYDSWQGTPAYVGSPTAGRTGTDKDMGYELSIGLEEKVEDFEFGTRKMLTIYNFGDATTHDGKYQTYDSDYGIESTLEVYFKATKYFKPYLGLGFGINKAKHSDSGGNLNMETYSPTLHAVAGAAGELIVGLGYYVQVKQRFANNLNTNYDVFGSTIALELDTVNGTTTTAGVSYQF